MKTVIEMAKEAGFEAKRGWGLRDFAPEDIFAAAVNITREIERFAELVRAEEREACAKVCDGFQARDVGMQPAECAGAIRARGEASIRGQT